MRVLWLDASRQAARLEERSATGPIHLGVELHANRETWRSSPLGPENLLVIGSGPFTLMGLFGSHRLTAVFRSPVTGGLHASTLGGAAWATARAGIDALVVEGRSREPCIVAIIDRGGGLEDEWRCIEQEELSMVYQGYKAWRGTRALHAYVEDMYHDRLEGLEYRILVVGPAAWTTLAGGIFSWNTRPGGGPGEVVDSASRGGGGTVMAQAHGVAAILVGGPRRARPRGDLAREVSRLLGKPYPRAVEAATTKYRYDPRLGTGGTFGVNYVHYRELLPALAYNTIYMSRAVRLLLHEKIIRHFWRPFQDEVFPRRGPRPWRTCGEPCSVACKKVWRGVKLDYEPAHAMGPMIGVITLEDAARLVELVDDLGLDAIETGHVVAWIFDGIAKGIIEPGEAGITGSPVLDPVALGPESSRANAGLAEAVIEGLVGRRSRIPAMVAQWGAREAARMIDEERSHLVKTRGLGARDLLVYAAFGQRGYMTPNYYWTPGMVAPLYVLGRYWTNYSPSYAEPEEYALSSLNRAVSELLLDNTGLCRFHRKWAERVLPALYREHLGVDDPRGLALGLYREIALYNIQAGAEPVPWESRKTMDIVATIAAELGVPGWEARIGDERSLLEWWHRFYGEIRTLLAL